MLRLENVHVSYGAIRALRGVSLAVEEGEIVTLIGANGAGKTTTLATISGLLRPTEGAITLGGNSLVGLPPHEIVRRGLCHVPEGRRLFAELTVEDNLALGAYLRRDKAGVRQAREHVLQLFPVLAARSRQLAGTLSGGEQQMLALGRALMMRPKLLLLDEPSLGLAPALVQQVLATVQQINSEGTTVLLVEQNAHLALAIARRGYVMETGTIRTSDTAAALLANEAVRQAYLGESV